jgi:hypothetical protein
MRLRRKGKKKNTFEASMEIDNPDIKIVTASYKKQPFFIGVGVSKQRELKGLGQVNLTEGVKGGYESQKDLNWELLYNPDALPKGFIPLEKAKGLMASTVAATSGSMAVFQPETTYKEALPVKLKGIKNELARVKSKDILEILFNQGFELDHVLPVSEGGSQGIENLRLVRKTDHRARAKPRERKKNKSE